MTHESENDPAVQGLVAMMRAGTQDLHAPVSLMGAVREAAARRQRRRTRTAVAGTCLLVAGVTAGAVLVGKPARQPDLSVADGPTTQAVSTALGPSDAALREASEFRTTWRRAVSGQTPKYGDSLTTQDSTYTERLDRQITRRGTDGRLNYGLLSLSWQQVLDLPSDEAALRQRLAAAGVTETGHLLAAAPGLLSTAPLTRDARLTLASILESAQGVDVVQPARDTAHRTGTRLAFRTGGGSYELIIDPDSGRLLEETDRRNPELTVSNTWLSWTAGPTDTSQMRPTEPPLRVLTAGAGDPALGRVVLPPRVVSALSELPPQGGAADLLAKTDGPDGTLYLVGTTSSTGRVRACTTAFSTDPAGRDGGVSCTGGGTAYGDLTDKTLGLGGSWSAEAPGRALLEGSAPAGTTTIVIEPSSGPAITLSVKRSGPRWADRAFFVADVARGPVRVRALNGEGQQLAAARSAGF